MKKVIALLLSLTFLFVGVVYAQVARNASPATITHTRSNFTNVGVTGLDLTGNPGYIAFSSTSTASGYQTEYYMWVDETGDVCVASWATIQAYSSFPSGNWSLDGIRAACGKVGGQS